MRENNHETTVAMTVPAKPGHNLQLPLDFNTSVRASGAATSTTGAEIRTGPAGGDRRVYELTRSRRKTLSICVDSGRLLVRAPLRASLRDIEIFIKEKSRWIDKQFVEDARKQRETLKLADGARFTALGKPYTLRILSTAQPDARKRSEAREANAELVITLGKSDNIAGHNQLERLFRNWLKVYTAAYLENGSHRLADALGLRAQLNRISFRFTRTKWGHCTSSGDIQYNPGVALAPIDVVDYIIAHEVCHLRYRNHSQRFWQLVAQSCPQWRDAEDWLKLYGHRANFSAAP
ncbi:MAG: SprT family zinc-dependent metalloprotease [Pseudomonadales bacterium]